MTTRRLDLKKWNEKRIPIEVQIRQLKDLIGTPGRGGTWLEYRELHQHQLSATILYMARAEQRNKLHSLVRVSYRIDPTVKLFTMEGGTNIMAKVIDPCTREEQQKAIEDHPLLADLYKPEVQVLVGTDPEFEAVAEANTQKILSAFQLTAVLGQTVHEAADAGDPTAIKAILGGG